MIATITYGDTSRALQVKGNNMVNKVYLSVGFPEILKLVAILLQMFDNEGNLLFLIGLLTLSIQCMAFRCLTNLGKDKIVLAALMTITIRTLVKYVFYTTQDILRIGVIN